MCVNPLSFSSGIHDEVRLIEAANWTGYSNVIWHDYFGSRKVIQDLSSLPGWSNGHVKVRFFDEDMF
jgi:hypothetical protein